MAERDTREVVSDLEGKLENEETGEKVTDTTRDGSGGSPPISTASSLIDRLGKFFAESLNIRKEPEEDEKLLHEVSVAGLVRYMLSERCTNVVVMVGAGMSTSAGIPDFRSPVSGIYANLKQYSLPCPEAMFQISYFREHPEAFFDLARQLVPLDVRPTPSHYFLQLLSEKGLLRRVYTQNIDGLERSAGIPEDKVVEAHGSFHSSHCLNPSCRMKYSFEWIKSKIFSDDDKSCVPKCEACSAVVKPDIVFFGEALPRRFFALMDEDFSACDLLIVIGTSLTVQPFASLIELVPSQVPRLAINLTPFRPPSQSDLCASGNAFDFDSESNCRDIFMQGRCDDMCLDLSERLGWREQLDKLIAGGEK